MRRILLRPVLLLVFAAAVILTLSVPRSARAQCDSPVRCIPAPGCAYAGNTVVFFPGTPVAIRNVSLLNPSHCEAPSDVDGLVVDSFFDVFVELEVSLNGGVTFGPAAWDRRISDIHIVHPPGTPPGIWRTEMVQLDLAGAPLPPSTMIRESPTKQSLGQTAITPNGGGYHIDSFFDVFTELSLDGGQTWVPADRSLPLNNVPSGPTPTRTATWGALKMLYR